MANNNFVVRNGLSVGSATIFAGNGDIITTGNISASGNIGFPGSNVIINSTTLTVGNTSIFSGNGDIITTGNIIASGTSSSGGGSNSTTPLYELDEFQTDGQTNLYPLYYNGQYTTVAGGDNISVTIDGVTQPSFLSNSEVTWLSSSLNAKIGYTLDTTQVSFATTANGTQYGNTIVVASAVNIKNGMLVTGHSINANTSVIDCNVTSRTVTISNALTGSFTSNAVVFAVTNIKFSEAPSAGSLVNIRTVAGQTWPVAKVYPFKPLDIVTGG
jgi:hypothetical protein